MRAAERTLPGKKKDRQCSDLHFRPQSLTPLAKIIYSLHIPRRRVHTFLVLTHETREVSATQFGQKSFYPQVERHLVCVRQVYPYLCVSLIDAPRISRLL